jgi:release factor glutamine methyltransferase
MAASTRESPPGRTRSIGSSDGLLDPSKIILPEAGFEAFPQSELARRLTEMSLSPATRSALGQAGQALARTYYPELFALFDPTVLDPAHWVAVRARLDPETARIVGLLLLCERARRRDLPEEVAGLIDALEDAGLCGSDPAGGTVWLPGLSLYRFRDAWIVAEPPHFAPTLFLGDDSLALANHLVPPRGGSVLDLCTGPGIQALVCSSTAAAVVAVEFNPVAGSLARVNAALNRRDDVIEVRLGDLYEPVAGEERFDLIVANPPYVPIPGDLPYPFVGDGGGDGLGLTRRIVEGGPRHLTADGRLQTLGITLSDGSQPLVLGEFQGWAAATGLDLSMTVTCHAPASAGSAWTRGMAGTIARYGELDHEEVVRALADGYRQQGATHVCAYFLTGRFGSGNLQLRDVSCDPPRRFWYA